MAALERSFFGVGKFFLIAVGFVRGRDDDLLDKRAAAAGFEQEPCAADVAFEGGERISVGDADNVCAAKCMTVRISYSPRVRSTRPSSQISPRTTLTFERRPLAESSDCGIQSRMMQVTSAPAATRRLTSHVPTRPVPPVTSVGRDGAFARISAPDVGRDAAARDDRDGAGVPSRSC
jgi:hypothetical protein